jgi:hypothetical protein
LLAGLYQSLMCERRQVDDLPACSFVTYPVRVTAGSNANGASCRWRSVVIDLTGDGDE